MMKSGAIIRVALVLCALVVGTRGHGYLKVPASRNFLANSDYCPHCLAAGGPQVVGAGMTYPEGNNGICGDPITDPAPRKHEAGGKYWTGNPAATYKKGQVIEIDLTITTNHNGRFSFSICPVGMSAKAERAELTEKCLRENTLVQANVPGAQQPGEKYFYTTPGDPVYTDYKMYYQLPEDLTCDGVTSRCVMQWYWTTGNTCTPKGTPKKYNRNNGIPDCGTPGSNYPEEFWNCADILIVEDNESFVQAAGDYGPVEPSSMGVAIQSITKPEESEKLPASYPLSYANYHCAEQETEYGKFADTLRGCTGYFECSHAGSWYFLCPKGFLFDNAKGVCDYSKNVVCPDMQLGTANSNVGPFWTI